VLVVDEQTKKLLDNILKEDDILDKNITSASSHPVRSTMRHVKLTTRFGRQISRSSSTSGSSRTWTPCTYSPLCHTSSTASWRISSEDGTEGAACCGHPVRGTTAVACLLQSGLTQRTSITARTTATDRSIRHGATADQRSQGH
jgi:hypothetical protein